MSSSSKRLAAASLHRILQSSGRERPPPSRTYNSMFECFTCQGLMLQPVCLPCGHSLCKTCLVRPLLFRHTDTIQCRECRKTFPLNPVGSTNKDRKPTILLQNSFAKWFPEWVESCRSREEGNLFAKEGDYPIAVQCYSKALATGVSDHRVLGNRSRAYLSMEQLDSALDDAVECCRIRPFWAKGYYRKAAVLKQKGRWRDAIAAYLLCVQLGGNDKSVDHAICELLCKHVPKGEEAALASIVQQCAGELKACRGWERELEVPLNLLKESDFECALCTSFLYIPVTTACGHSFCQACVSRSFDHTPFCPVCRMPLAEAFNQYCSNSGVNEDVTLARILKHFFPSAYAEKEASANAEALSSSRVGTCESLDLPVFVCTMAYPSIACPLHVFEPRYRLMLRRCVESGARRFGMCQPAEEKEGSGFSFSDYGTVLYISSVEHTPDGRSLLTATGERRFRVVSRSMCDGYHTARISFLHDTLPSTPEETATLRTLQEEVYEHAKKWFSALSYLSQLVLIQTACSPPPEIDPSPELCPNGPAWVWWFVHAVPTSPQRKLEFLRSTSLKQRLTLLKDILPLPS